ncbi:hypothetical protein AQ773_17745 [Burkholderia pseudomallei]|nr:hypothetical protein AQ729_12530 [Burkholderia pseudomallei]OMU07317.1 hypothetical protein AQ769_26385 [Burkholderia pseudomallei]OMU26599.1 hypothetical protein AQ773_17745 [Burkholderia pseudomallei]OMU78625.1 hypothetical protein AQ782_07795 [Burkholderia pseudomallei]OMU91427.1 hypothetical protein AQ781_25940 [Burkholderia pseudomallei]
MTRSFRMERGDILMTRIGSIGDCKLIDWDVDASFYVSLALLKIHGASSAYFEQYSKTHSFKREVELHSLASAIPRKINLGPISDVKIVLPPPAEQSAIASALSDVDALLSSLDALIAKKRDIKQAAMQQLLTGKTRLPGFEGEWAVTRLGDHATLIRNGVYSRAELSIDGSVKYLHYGDIHTSGAVHLNPSNAIMPFLDADKAVRLGRLVSGDLVFVDATEDLAGVGKSVEIVGAEGTEVVAGLHTIAVRFEKRILADGFKAYLQFIPAFGAHLRSLAAGTKVLSTNRSHIASAEIALPSIAEQAAIAQVLSDMDVELAALEARRDKTRLLKQGMMQELLTGKTRLV